MEGLRSFVLPAFTLGVNAAALIARITRSSVLDVLGQDFIRTAYPKGASPARVICVHVLRNGAIPSSRSPPFSSGISLGARCSRKPCSSGLVWGAS